MTHTKKRVKKKESELHLLCIHESPEIESITYDGVKLKKYNGAYIHKVVCKVPINTSNKKRK